MRSGLVADLLSTASGSGIEGADQNQGDNAMKFGLFHSVQLPDPSKQQQYYQDALAQVLWAEQLGYESVWLTEHHFTQHGIISASLAVLAYLAGLTHTIRLATAVTVLPFHNPIQLAEAAATVDLLSNGRLDLGIGRGYQWGEFHRLNLSMAEADRRFQESIQVLTQAWTAQAPFEHQGEFWTFHDMTVYPRPVQVPHPPLWVAASSTSSMDRIVRNQWNLLIGQGLTLQQVGEQVAYFRHAHEHATGTYDPHRVKVARAMYTAPTAEQARRDAEQPFLWFKKTADEVSAPPGRRIDLLPDNFQSYRRRFATEAAFHYQDMVEQVLLFGSPEQVAERVEALRQAGVESLILFVNFGGIDSQKVHDSLALFATEVMPQFKD
jgi:alkanesulfonate monooxygenase SsuD/methylene tetrahydromethanopterin reductase-like flavin-dependent oxidoreductase (luciferase family)